VKHKNYIKHFILSVFALLGFTAVHAQNHWQPVSSAIDPFYQVENIDDTLYGYVVQDSTWQIRRFEDGFWKPYPSVKLINERPITVAHLSGELYVLTPSRLLRFLNGKWQTITSGPFLNMVSYNGKIIVYGSFTAFLGDSCSGLGYWDGTTGGALKTIGGQKASITGWVTQMRVINNELYFLGDFSNTQQGPTLSNTAIWNDTAWRQAFTPLSSKPATKDVVKWNGDLYFSLDKTPTNSIGVYKLVGQQLQAVVPLDSGIGMYNSVDQMVVFNNRLYAATNVNEYKVDQFGQTYIVPRQTLLFYDGVKWRDSGDTLNTNNSTLNKLVMYNGELYGNNVPMVGGKPYVGKIENTSASAMLALVDVRDTNCTLDSAYQFIPAVVQVQANGSTNYYYSSKTGPVAIPLSDSAVSTITVKTPLPYYSPSMCSDTMLMLNTSAQKTHEAFFYVTPPNPVTDMAVSITAQTGWRARHGFYDDYFIVVTNQGTDSVIGATLELEHPAETNWHAGTHTPTSTTGTAATYGLPPIAPGGLVTVVAKMHNTTSLSIGDTVNYRATVITSNDAQTENNVDSLAQEVVAAYDPNNKLVDREGIEEWGGNLVYQINFQNLGNDTAYRVVVVDTLSPNLRLETFELITASHDVNIRMEKGIIQFIFDDIRLPDSASSSSASKGFVQFTIGMQSGLADEDTLANRAFIYFDFQPAVITNYAQTYKVLPNPNIDPANPISNWLVYPNPSRGILTIETLVDRSYWIYNYTGQIVNSGVFPASNIPQQLDLTGLADGVYLLVEEYGSLRKIIIQR
jgi:uncharacterized repeat protein (TIGR01451 family)